MFHPDLGVEIDAANEGQAAVYAESGWKPAPEPEARPGYEPEPVKYAPVTSGDEKSDAKPVKRSSRSTDS
jgi:hypothetical protein